MLPGESQESMATLGPCSFVGKVSTVRLAMKIKEDHGVRCSLDVTLISGFNLEVIRQHFWLACCQGLCTKGSKLCLKSYDDYSQSNLSLSKFVPNHRREREPYRSLAHAALFAIN